MGFDTGYNGRSFARAKLTLFINQPGFIVYPEPDARIESWQAEGVSDSAIPGSSTMIVFGPHFPGEDIHEIINDGERKEEALDALRFWLAARMRLENNQGSELQIPSGASLIVTKKSRFSFGKEYPLGTIFFPPSRLLNHTLNSDNAFPELYMKADLKGLEGISYLAGVMLYNIFCGVPPFSPACDGIFIPPNLASPGIAGEMSDLINRAIGAQPKAGEPRPTPKTISDFLGEPFTKPVSTWIEPLDNEEISSIILRHKQYVQKESRAIKKKKHLNRHTPILIGSLVALLILSLFIREILLNRPQSTKGLPPLKLVEAYYYAYSILDHSGMKACVKGKAGKEDIELAANLHVISRVRQAYEKLPSSFIPVREWLDSGSPATGQIVFGLTDLEITILSEDKENAKVEAKYVLWIPGESSVDSRIIKASLELVNRKGQWLIQEIYHETR